MDDQSTLDETRYFKSELYTPLVDLQQFESNMRTACLYGHKLFLDCQRSEEEQFPTEYAALYSAVKSDLDQENAYQNPAFLLRVNLQTKAISLMKMNVPWGVFEQLSEEERLEVPVTILAEQFYVSLLSRDLSDEFAAAIGEAIMPAKRPLYSASMSMSPNVAKVPMVFHGEPPAPEPEAPKFEVVGEALDMSEISKTTRLNLSNQAFFRDHSIQPHSMQRIQKILRIEDAENAVVLVFPANLNVVFVARPGQDINTVKENQVVALDECNRVMYMLDAENLN